jgi:hypothetical protein
MTNLYVYIFLAALVILFPKDALLLPLWVEAQIKLHYINAKTFWFAWTLHRKLSKEFASQGWPVPPFKFVPIWKR